MYVANVNCRVFPKGMFTDYFYFPLSVFPNCSIWHVNYTSNIYSGNKSSNNIISRWNENFYFSNPSRPHAHS